MQAVAGAIQFYYQDRNDYPLMRYNDVIPVQSPAPAGPITCNDSVPNAPQSIEACLYMVEYGSSGGKALQSLPAKVLQADRVRLGHGGPRRYPPAARDHGPLGQSAAVPPAAGAHPVSRPTTRCPAAG